MTLAIHRYEESIGGRLSSAGARALAAGLGDADLALENYALKDLIDRKL